jgi:signal transduction histidine kinase
MARELNDTLLQSLHGLSMLFHFAAQGLPEDQPARASLLKALARADEVFLDARRKIEYMRDADSEPADFADRLAKLAEEIEVQRSIAFKVEENGEALVLDSATEERLHEIVREALVNTLRHSNASSAEVSLEYGSSELLLKCCDSGLGLPTSMVIATTRAGHQGLMGMREGAILIDGKLEFWSSPRSGTEIEVRVPARRAYRYPAARFFWLQRFLRFRRRAIGMDLTP